MTYLSVLLCKILISGCAAVYMLVSFDLFHSLYSVCVLISETLFSDVFICLVYLHVEMQAVCCSSCSYISY